MFHRDEDILYTGYASGILAVSAGCGLAGAVHVRHAERTIHSNLGAPRSVERLFLLPGDAAGDSQLAGQKYVSRVSR